MKWYTLARRCAQLSVLVLFCMLPWITAAGFGQIRGSLFSLHFFGLPFADPVAALQVAAEGMMTAGALLWGAVCSLILALFLGRVFCSWVCPYGFLSELLYGVAARWPRSKAAPKRETASAKHALAFAAKGFILVAGLSLVILLEYPVLNVLGMPGELSLVPVLVWQGAGVLFLLSALALPAAALALEVISGRRLWCRYVCPQSVLLGTAARCLPAKAPGLRIGWTAAHCSCRGDAPCRAACPLQLNPRRPDGPERRDCTVCGECLRACESRGGALGWKVFHRQHGRPED